MEFKLWVQGLRGLRIASIGKILLADFNPLVPKLFNNKKKYNFWGRKKHKTYTGKVPTLVWFGTKSRNMPSFLLMGFFA